MEIKHAQTPWYTAEGVTGCWFIRSESRNELKDPIAVCGGRSVGNERDHASAGADAAFIVRACNAHDLLMAVAREVIAYEKGQRGGLSECVRMAGAALVKGGAQS